MKYASVCSGVEAASLAWEYLGWEPAWFSEIEPFPCAVLKERFPNVPNLGDMTKIKVENLENGDQRFTNEDGADVIVRGGVDLLVGGTPCQGFSVAGKQGGLQDDRSVLCLTFCQLLADMRPRWFVWENVPGVFSTGGGEDFKAFLRKVNEVGYCCGWRVLDAQYTRVDGYPRAVPQRRRRVFVIGHLGNEWQYPAEVLFEPTGLSWNTPPRRIKGKGFAGNAERCVGDASTVRMRAGCDGGGKGALVSHERSLTLAAAGNDQAVFTTAMSIGNGQPAEASIMMEECCQTLNCMHDQQAVMCIHGAETPIYNSEHSNPVTCNHAGLENVVCYENHANDSRITESNEVSPLISSRAGTVGGNLPLVQECIGYYPSQHYAPKPCETPTLTTDNGARIRGDSPLIQECYAFEPGIAKREGGDSRFVDECSGTLRSNAGDNQTAVATNATVRRLLPVECERLMGFPDNWTRIPWKGKPEEDCPDGPRYKACGNSMCVNVMRWIGMRIEMVERRMKGEEK